MMYNKAIDYYISYCLKPVIVKIHEGYPDDVLWVKNEEVIVRIKDSEYFWLLYSIWDDISRMFDLNYAETNYVIRMWLEQHHNLGKLIPMRKTPSRIITLG